MFQENSKAQQEDYSNQYAELEDEVILDPEQTKLLLSALKTQHVDHIQKFQVKLNSTRSVYSRQLKRDVFASSWEPLKLHVKEGPLPPEPQPKTSPKPEREKRHRSREDTQHSSSSGNESSECSDSERSSGFSSSDETFDDANNDEGFPHNAGGSEINEMDVANFHKREARRNHRREKRKGRKRRKRRKKKKPQVEASETATTLLSVSDWLNQRRMKQLPQYQQEERERQEREAEQARLKAKKYSVMLPEDVRGSTANMLHVIRKTMNTFSVQGMSGQTRTLYGQKIKSPRDLFRAMDRDGDGSLDHDELRAALHRLGIDMTDMQFVQLINRVDTDRSGSIDVKELENAIMHGDNCKKDEKELTEEEREAIMNAPDKAIWARVWRYLKEKGIRVTKLFHDIDEDWSGIITPEELREGLDRLLGLKMSDDEFELALKIVDKDRSGEIEYKELARAVKYGDPDRADMTSGLPTDEEMAAAAAMHGRYSVRKHKRRKVNQWDRIWVGGIEEIRKSRKPNPLFSERVHATQDYVSAMNLPKGTSHYQSHDVDIEQEMGEEDRTTPVKAEGPNTTKTHYPLSRTSRMLRQGVPAAQIDGMDYIPKPPSPRPGSKVRPARDMGERKRRMRGGLTKSIEEVEQEERERFSKMSLIDRGGLTRKQYKLRQRLLALNPNPKGILPFKDKKKYGVDSKDGIPIRGDPGGVLAALAAKKLAAKMKAIAEKQLREAEERAKKFGREKVIVAQKRWSNLRSMTKVAGIIGASRTTENNSDEDDDLPKNEDGLLPTPKPPKDDPSLPRTFTEDGKPIVLHHPKRVLAFVEAQKRAGRHCGEALKALRKQVGSVDDAKGVHAFFTVEDALVARAGIINEIQPDPEIARRAEAERERRRARQLKKRGKSTHEKADIELVMTLDQEAMVEESLIGIAKYIHKRRARVVDVFRTIDHDGGGSIDRDELEWGLKRFGINVTGEHLDMVVKVFDADGSGNIDFKEFNAAVKYAHRLYLREIQKAKAKAAKEKEEAAERERLRLAKKKEKERRENQHAALAKMERDRKMRQLIQEEVRSLHKPTSAAEVAKAALAKAAKERNKVLPGASSKGKVAIAPLREANHTPKKVGTVRFAEVA